MGGWEVARGNDIVQALFATLCSRVCLQGETLNNIEAQVRRGADAVVKGAELVQEAKRYRDKTRKLWCWGAIIVVIIIILIVIFTVRPWQYVN